jgi:hypothetical protein
VVRPGALEALQRYVELSRGMEHAHAAKEMLNRLPSDSESEFFYPLG